ncbi:MAG: multicopper oxidase domain-containing protein [Euryarchaeota archaeon]|nr:multicopper oxidase domain-containing protein [Euryarchaeota archaeon]
MNHARALLIAAVAAGLLVSGALLTTLSPPAGAATTPRVREYTLTVEAADIPVGPGSTWHAWTYNGTVPGPLLRVKAGETLRVKVINKHNLTHSFHTHLAPYEPQFDGSQVNTITGVGKGAMIPPGGEYTYEFHPTTPGIFYYHCHSADGGFHIHQHIAQGLYGAIVVEEPDAPAMKEEAIFMAEIGHQTEGKNTPYYIMNGKGIPGGEKTLEKIFAEKGVAGVVEQFGKTVPVVKAKAGESVRLHVINIGDQIHSYHLHGMNLKSENMLPGRIWPANVVQLVPGGADTIVVTPTEEQKGVWLFHCHVVGHADAGMIGVMVVE